MPRPRDVLILAARDWITAADCLTLVEALKNRLPKPLFDDMKRTLETLIQELQKEGREAIERMPGTPIMRSKFPGLRRRLR